MRHFTGYTVIAAARLLSLEVLWTVISYFRESAIFHKTCSTAIYSIQKTLIKKLSIMAILEMIMTVPFHEQTALRYNKFNILISWFLYWLATSSLYSVFARLSCKQISMESNEAPFLSHQFFLWLHSTSGCPSRLEKNQSIFGPTRCTQNFKKWSFFAKLITKCSSLICLRMLSSTVALPDGYDLYFHWPKYISSSFFCI